MASAGEGRESLERALADARAELESATRAREILLAGIAHDLRNPLNTFAMSAGLLREDLEGADLDRTRALSLLTRMDRAAARMMWLIEDLLEASRVEAKAFELAPAATAPPTVLEDAAEQAKAIVADKGATIVVGDAPIGAAATLDRARTAQALAKLVAVSLRSTGEGATIALSADLDGDAVRFHVRATARSSTRIAHDENRSGLALVIARGLLGAQGGALTTDTSTPGALTLTASFPRG